MLLRWDSVWERIKTDLKQGDFGMARDRIHGVLGTLDDTPDRLADQLKWRRKLGDIYFALQYPAKAGLYWYLEEKRTPEMEEAIKVFETSRGCDPLQILKALEVKSRHVEHLKTEFARQTIRDLADGSKKLYGFTYKDPGRRHRYEGGSFWDHPIRNLGCATIGIAFICAFALIFFTGLTVVGDWLMAYFSRS